MVAWPAMLMRHQRVVDAPDRAEQADEGRGGADRGQHGQAGLQARGGFVDGVAQRAREPVAHVQRVVQVRLGVAVVRGGFAAFERQGAEGVGRVVAQLVEAVGEVGAVPEALGAARACAAILDAGPAP